MMNGEHPLWKWVNPPMIEIDLIYEHIQSFAALDATALQAQAQLQGNISKSITEAVMGLVETEELVCGRDRVKELLIGAKLHCHLSRTNILVDKKRFVRLEIYTFLNETLLDFTVKVLPCDKLPELALDYANYAAAALTLTAYKEMLLKVFGFDSGVKLSVHYSRPLTPILKLRELCLLVCTTTLFLSSGLSESFNSAFVRKEVSINIVSSTKKLTSYRQLAVASTPESRRVGVVIGNPIEPFCRDMVLHIIQPLRYLRWKCFAGGTVNDPDNLEVPPALRALPNCDSLLKDFMNVYQGPVS